MMKTIIVKSQEEADQAEELMANDGYLVAAISNTGLPPGQARITFLPESAFEQRKDDATTP